MSNTDGSDDAQNAASLPPEHASEQVRPTGDDWRQPSATPAPTWPTSRTPAPPPAVRGSSEADAAPSQLPGLAGFRARLRPSPASKTLTPPATPALSRISRDPDGTPTPLTTLSSLQTPLAPSSPMVPPVPTSGAEGAGVDARPTRLRAPGSRGGYSALVVATIATISLVLLIALGGVLLLGHGFLVGQHSGRPTPQANTPPTLTAEANALATQASLMAHAGLQPLTTPYHIQVPGSCGDDSGVWQNSYAAPDHLKCLSTSVQLTAIGNSAGFLEFIDPITGPMNQHYAASIYVSQLQTTGCATLAAYANYDMRFQVCGNGEVTIMGDQQIWYNGYIAPSANFTLKLAYDGAHMLFALNQRSIISYPTRITVPLLNIGISIETAPITSYNMPLTTGSSSADFSDFTYTPLP